MASLRRSIKKPPAASENVKKTFLDYLKSFRVVIVVGETGSGKSSYIAKYGLDYLRSIGSEKAVCCTQPRRICPIKLAPFVDSLLPKDGPRAGYHVRHERSEGPDVKLWYKTEGIVQREYVHDRGLSEYGIIILDEAHERQLSTDVLIGFLFQALLIRNDLKVVVMSASMNEKLFATYFERFGVSPTLKIAGGSGYQLKIVYRPLRGVVQMINTPAVREANQDEEYDSDSEEGNYLDALRTQRRVSEMVARIVLEILNGRHKIEQWPHPNQPPAVLVFAAGISAITEIIYSVKSALKEKKWTERCVVCPLMASSPHSAQQFALRMDRDNKTKVVVCTNVAESSITIDGVGYVIDTGYYNDLTLNNREYFIRVSRYLLAFLFYFKFLMFWCHVSCFYGGNLGNFL